MIKGHCVTRLLANKLSNNDTSESGLPVLSSGHDNVCRVPANCSGPRTASCLHGGEQYGRRPLLSRTVLPSYILRTRGVSAGIVSWLSAKLLHILGLQQTGLPPDALAYDVHSTSVLTGPVQHNRDAYMVLSAL